MKIKFKISKYCGVFFSLILVGCTGDDMTIEAPSNVTNFTATAGVEEVVLSWNKVKDSSLKEYWITVSPLIVDAILVNKDSESITIKNLKGNTTYTFTLITKNTVGKASTGVSASATPAVVDRTPPAEVTNFIAASEDSKITLNWTKPADSDFAGYELTYQPGNGNVTLGNDVETYVINGLVNGTNYDIILKTKDLQNNVSAGKTIKAMPSEIILAVPQEVTDVSFKGFYSATAPTFTTTWADPIDTNFKEIELTYFIDPTSPTTVVINKGVGSYIIDGTGKYEKYFTVILKTKSTEGVYSEGVTKKIRFGNFAASTQEAVDAFDSSIVGIIAGKLNISNGTNISDISNFSNLKSIEGKLDITNTLLTDLNAFSKLTSISGKVTISGNTLLTNLCGLKNAASSMTDANFIATSNAGVTTTRSQVLSCN